MYEVNIRLISLNLTEFVAY